MNVPLLDLQAQHRTIKDEVLAAVHSVIERQAFIMGAEVAQLEQAVAKLCATKHGVACASGTDALLIPLRALALQPGDEVIAPAFTFFATAGAISNAGGRPVFIDVDAATFNVTAKQVEAAITPRTKAVVVVHLYGQMVEIEKIAAVCAKKGIALIEDGAQAVGARRKVDGQWRTIGELGTVGTLSFFPTKNLGGWGDGGLMVTQDDTFAAKLKSQRLHGGTREYYHDEVGLNSRLDTLQAAVLLAKLNHLAQWNDARRKIAARYDAEFKSITGVTAPAVDAANEHIYHQYTIRAERRDALTEHLKAKGIGHKIYYPLALHQQPCFAFLGYKSGSLPVTEKATAEVVSLPIYPELTDAQQEAVVAAVRGFYGA
ncbi:MAG TPA: DegT/DnrJ/EryC1/StrS family aminotransferase [Gemmatimonadales bacterium]